MNCASRFAYSLKEGRTWGEYSLQILKVGEIRNVDNYLIRYNWMER